MKYLKTVSGKEFDLLWDGISVIDGILRFAIANVSLSEAFTIFSNPEETSILIRVWDGIEYAYIGYSDFRGINLDSNGELVVSMAINE